MSSFFLVPVTQKFFIILGVKETKYILILDKEERMESMQEEKFLLICLCLLTIHDSYSGTCSVSSRTGMS